MSIMQAISIALIVASVYWFHRTLMSSRQKVDCVKRELSGLRKDYNKIFDENLKLLELVENLNAEIERLQAAGQKLNDYAAKLGECEVELERSRRLSAAQARKIQILQSCIQAIRTTLNGSEHLIDN